MKTKQVCTSKSNQDVNSSGSKPLNSKNIFYRFFQFSTKNNQDQTVVSPHFNNDTFVAVNGSYNKNGTSNSVSNNNDKHTKKGKFKKVLSSMSTGVKVLVFASALYLSTLGCSERDNPVGSRLIVIINNESILKRAFAIYKDNHNQYSYYKYSLGSNVADYTINNIYLSSDRQNAFLDLIKNNKTIRISKDESIPNTNPTQRFIGVTYINPTETLNYSFSIKNTNGEILDTHSVNVLESGTNLPKEFTLYATADSSKSVLIKINDIGHLYTGYISFGGVWEPGNYPFYYSISNVSEIVGSEIRKTHDNATVSYQVISSNNTRQIKYHLTDLNVILELTNAY